MPSDFFWMSFCKVLSLAWGLFWNLLFQSLFRVSTLIREEQMRCRCLRWEPTCSELQEECVRGQPLQSFCITGIPSLLLFAQGTGLLLGALCQWGRRDFVNLTFSLTLTLRWALSPFMSCAFNNISSALAWAGCMSVFCKSKSRYDFYFSKWKKDDF